MGLEGTLRVFSLTDIFQMLGLQRKTGVLNVEGDDDTITISFLGGQVVAAESTARRLENRLGNLLIRVGYVTQEQLDQVLVIQQETGQRMGFLLVREGLIDPQELRQALRLQIARIVYSAFRWSDGHFRFSQEGMVDYDADHMAPVSIDSILMEAAQMVDEWPVIEKKVGSLATVYRRAPGVEELKLVAGEKNAPEGRLSVGKSVAMEIPASNVDTLRMLADKFRERYPKAGAAVLVTGTSVIAVLTEDLVKKGLKAGDLIMGIGRKGGGRPNLAQGSLPGGVQEALSSVLRILEEKIK